MTLPSIENEDAAYLWAALEEIQKRARLIPAIPSRATMVELQKILTWSERKVYRAIAWLRDNSYLVANFGGGYFIAEVRSHMDSTCRYYQSQALTELKRLRKMQAASAQLDGAAPQIDFFQEVINKAGASGECDHEIDPKIEAEYGAEACIKCGVTLSEICPGGPQ